MPGNGPLGRISRNWGPEQRRMAAFCAGVLEDLILLYGLEPHKLAIEIVTNAIPYLRRIAAS